MSDLLAAGATARAVGETGAEPRLLRLRARRLMRSPPPSLDPEVSLAEAERLFQETGAEWLPVVEGGQLVGVLNRRDVDRALLRSRP